MLDQTLQKISLFENVKYRFSVQGEPGLQVWTTLSEDLGADGTTEGWTITTAGFVQPTEAPGKPFRSVQRFDARRKMVSYSFEEPARWNVVERKQGAYVFSDGKHVISSIEIPEVDFLMESNNFGGLAALLALHGARPGTRLSLMSLPQGSHETLPLEFAFDEDGIADFCGVKLKIDADGRLVGNVDGPGQLVIECLGPQSLPDELTKDIFAGHLDCMHFYPVSYRDVEIPSPTGTIFATYAENPARKTGAQDLAVLVGGTGRYNRDGQTLAGANVGYGRIMDAFAFYGLPSLRYDRRAALGSREMFTHEEIAQQAAAVIAHGHETMGREVVLIGHSYGALVSARLARRAHGVKALVLVSAPAKSLMETIRWQRQQAMHKIANPEMKARYRQAAEDFDRKLAPAFDVDKLTHSEMSSILFIRSLGNQVIGDLLAEVDVPVLIIQGALDEQVPETDAHEIKADLDRLGKRSRLAVLPDFGHLLNPMAEGDAAAQQAPKFDREIYKKIDDFLAAVPGAAVH